MVPGSVDSSSAPVFFWALGGVAGCRNSAELERRGARTPQSPRGAAPEQRRARTTQGPRFTGGAKEHRERRNGCVRRTTHRYRGGMSHRDLNVLDAANRAADLVNQLIDKSPRGRLLHVRQMRDSVQSIGANISEGFGRGTGRDRDRSLEIGRGETEETVRHVAANFRARRITAKEYWPIRNRLVVIGKMLTAIIRH